VVAERAAALQPSTPLHAPLPEELVDRAASLADALDAAPLAFAFDAPGPNEPRAVFDSVGFVDAACWANVPAARAASSASAGPRLEPSLRAAAGAAGASPSEEEEAAAAAAVVLRVRRTNRTAGALKVRYGTVPGSAAAGVHFAPKFGVLEIPAGEAEVELRVDLRPPRWQGGRARGETRDAAPLAFLAQGHYLSKARAEATAAAEAAALSFTVVLKAPSLRLVDHDEQAASSASGGRLFVQPVVSAMQVLCL
jgi:hypothetical protein